MYPCPTGDGETALAHWVHYVHWKGQTYFHTKFWLLLNLHKFISKTDVLSASFLAISFLPKIKFYCLHAPRLQKIREVSHL